ncbi:hypothetical protein NE865_02234 [Phthorimaea operculella]|nr:hypothetical protein NE865_02234 [Phthorimaea operculella]
MPLPCKLPCSTDDKKGPTCKKITNPCKICLQAVKPKTGVQCQGACEAWVHYECLNYTPGKILDIRKGFITITCPCPDCKTTVPKEFRTTEPYACNNVQCPANNPPCCEQFECQANEMSRCQPPKCPPAGTLRHCDANICRDFSHPNAFQSTADDPCMEGYLLKTYCGDSGGPGTKPASVRITGDGGPVPITDECGRTYTPTSLPVRPCKDEETSPPPSQGSPSPPQPGRGGPLPLQPGKGGPLPGQRAPFPNRPAQGATFFQRGRQAQNGVSPETVQQICNTVGNLANQLNILMDSLKGFGAPGPGGPGGPGRQQQQPQGAMKACGSGGHSCGGTAGCQKCRKTNITSLNCTGGCGPPGQPGCATGCGQPCHCPNNPARK